ncbi:MAG: maleylpyruvate isomerase family mycothiol-dependent enzyme [Actinobacteria bacterium]|nr:maleylpyruvate isomerase family mycothiol-dependent enzyme [Actinomycetota bacterium]
MSTEHDDLLGAWAIDALDADERAFVDAALENDPALRRVADRLRSAVAAVAEGDAMPPPHEVRASMLESARAARVHPGKSSPVEAFRHQVEAFGEVVEAVAGEQWQLRASPYRWTLHGLVAHLLQIERYMERALGFADGPADEFEADHLAFGQAGIADELTRSPESTAAAWREVVARIDPRLDSIDLDRELTFHQWPFSVGSLLIARAFEIWTHADDIRRAVGVDVVSPSPTDVRAMSDTSVSSLPLAIHVVADHVPDGTARLVLTGDGGGVWDLQLGRGGPELVSIVADAVDYCRVASRRIGVDELSATVEGDAALADRLLTAATIIAV